MFTAQQLLPLKATHLSDGCAELALKDLLQRLELVTGDVTRLLQLLQQLDCSGNIWRKEGERISVCVTREQRRKKCPTLSSAGANQWVV